MWRRPIKIAAFTHRWLGYPLAVLFLIIAVSGEYIAIDNLLSRIDRHGQSYDAPTDERMGEALARLLNRYPNASGYDVPVPDRPFYRVTNRGHEVVLSAVTLDVIGETTASDTAIRRWFLSLHRTYLKGGDGRHIVAWVALTAVVIGLIGLAAWYPYRHATRWRTMLPGSLSRPKLFRSHFTLGLIGLPMVLLFGLTGAAMTYRPLTRDLLAVERTPTPDRFAHPHYVPRDWAARIALAKTYFPNGQLVGLSKPRNAPPGQTLIEIRFSLKGDWGPIGGSAVTLRENDSGFIGIRRFGDLPGGEKMYRLIRPLHDGTAMPVGYLWLLVIANGLLILMTVTALFSFLQKSYRAPRPLFRKFIRLRA